MEGGGRLRGVARGPPSVVARDAPVGHLPRPGLDHGEVQVAVLGALDVGFYASYVDAFEVELKKAGGEIVTREAFGLKDRDMSPQLTKIRELQPDAVMFSDVGPDIRWVGNEQGWAGDTCWAMLKAAGFTDDDLNNWRR